MLDAEAGSELAELEFTRHRLSPWAYVRWRAAMALSDAISGTDYLPALGHVRPPLADRARYVAQAFRHHPRLSPGRRFPIVFFCSGVGNFERDGVYINRLVDHFAGCLRDDTLLVEDSASERFSRPRRFPHLAYHDAIQIRAVVQGELTPLGPADRRAIDDVIALLRRLLGDALAPAVFDQLRDRLSKAARRSGAWYTEYQRLFDRVRPELILLEDACYGERSHIVRWARERGIVTAEYQHGFIGPNHEAYNCAAPLHTGRYAANFPEHFLTYGRYWGRQIRIPSHRVDVGNPHLTEETSRITRRSVRRTVLFVSGLCNPPLYRGVLPAIAAALPAGVSLVFRPHPAERERLDRYGDLFDRHAIEIDREPMAYQSVVDADLVVGDISTLLFEATAFGRPVVVVDHPETRKHVAPGTFPVVADPSRISTFLDRPPEPMAEEMWAPGWRERYAGFVRSVRA